MNIFIKEFLKYKEKIFPDRKFRRARIWSNQELKKIANLFEGDIINVSGWKDSDKRDGFYRDYFPKAKSYWLSNFSGPSGFQGNNPNEIFLDLEKDLDNDFVGKFDVVFNHTTLEHVYNFQKAFQNLCHLSKDVVIIVLPFLQQLHAVKGDYEDYWRFSPYAIEKMMKENGLALLYMSANNKKSESVYVFAVGTKNPLRWAGKIQNGNQDFFNNLGDKAF